MVGSANLEGEFGPALRLPGDDEHQAEADHEQNTQGHDVPPRRAPLHRQDAEGQNQQPCKGGEGHEKCVK